MSRRLRAAADDILVVARVVRIRSGESLSRGVRLTVRAATVTVRTPLAVALTGGQAAGASCSINQPSTVASMIS